MTGHSVHKNDVRNADGRPVNKGNGMIEEQGRCDKVEGYGGPKRHAVSIAQFKNTDGTRRHLQIISLPIFEHSSRERRQVPSKSHNLDPVPDTRIDLGQTQ